MLVSTDRLLPDAARAARFCTVAAVLLLAPISGASASSAFLPAKMPVSPPAGASALCATYGWACRRSGAAGPLTQAQWNRAADVNRRINRTVREISDRRQYRRDEVWALPTARGGDCEDFALAKKNALVAEGIAPERLLLVTALDTRRNQHAVLVLRTGSGDFVLDNLRDSILRWDQTGYTFLRMQNPAAPSSWIAVLDGGVLKRS